MSDLQERWRAANDKELASAAEHLGEYTEEAIEIIRAELRCRNMADPGPPPAHVNGDVNLSEGPPRKYMLGLPYWAWSVSAFSVFYLWKQMRDFYSGESSLAAVWIAIAFGAGVAVAVFGWWISKRSRLSRSRKILSVTAAVLFMAVAAFEVALGLKDVGTCISGDCQSGQGTFVYAFGATYEGDWRNGRPAGQGTIKFEDGYKYEGAWREDAPEGWGTSTWPNGDVYIGEHSGGWPHGRGTKTYSDGRVESGSWAFGQLGDEISEVE